MVGLPILTVADMGIDTHQEPVIYMRKSSEVALAEGFNASSRVEVQLFDEQSQTHTRSIIASLNVVDDDKLAVGNVGLSKIALKRLVAESGDKIVIRHAPLVDSTSLIRKKIYGERLNDQEIQRIIDDVSGHRLTDIEIASFLSACAGQRLNLDEIIALTRAMVSCGKKISWPNTAMVFDKHCIGGLPGNRTTPLVVAIVSAAGYVIPKTSSRAITSPAGTADTMETITTVKLSLEEMQQVVKETGACLAWGGAVNLSPADDLLIRIERALDLDGEGQLVASVLSKKIAAGSTHAVIDIPVGETAKVRSQEQARHLGRLFESTGHACGINIRTVITDGSSPVGRGIGPTQEAKDLLAVLKCEKSAPADLRNRAIVLAANIIDLANACGLEAAKERAASIIDNGDAWRQFQKIVGAQGGFKDLQIANYLHREISTSRGVLVNIDNRKLSRLAKLAGAPFNKTAGLRLEVQVGQAIREGQSLFSLYADSAGELEYALDYYRKNKCMFQLEDERSYG